MFQQTEQLFQCPKCRHHNHKLYVNSDKGLFQCFHCSFSGPISRLKAYPAIYSQVEDKESLAAFNRLQTAKIKAVRLNSELLKPLQPFHTITESDSEFDYLLSRGFDEDIIECYNILVSDNEKYIDRVFITIEDSKENTVFYTGRSIHKGVNPKYLNSVAQKDFVFMSKTPVDGFYVENAYICEGIFDAFKIPGGIALLGKTLSKDQYKVLFDILRNKKNIYICLDPGTEKETARLAKELDSWFPNKDIHMMTWGSEKGIDLGDLSQRMSRTDLMNFIHEYSYQFTSKLF